MFTLVWFIELFSKLIRYPINRLRWNCHASHRVIGTFSDLYLYSQIKQGQKMKLRNLSNVTHHYTINLKFRQTSTFITPTLVLYNNLHLIKRLLKELLYKYGVTWYQIHLWNIVNIVQNILYLSLFLLQNYIVLNQIF